MHPKVYVNEDLLRHHIRVHPWFSFFISATFLSKIQESWWSEELVYVRCGVGVSFAADVDTFYQNYGGAVFGGGV